MDNWDKLIKEMNDELSSEKQIVKKKVVEQKFFESLAKEIIEQELTELDLKTAGQAVVKTAKKAAGAVQRAWMKVKTKIKEVAQFGFRFGVALGKTKDNKFVLFNKQGNIQTPAANKASFESIGQKKLLTLTYTYPDFSMPLQFSDSLNRIVGTSVLNKNKKIGIMYVQNNIKSQIREGIDYTLPLLDEQDEDDDVEELGRLQEITFRSMEDPESIARLTNTEDKPIRAKPVDITQAEFQNKLASLMDSVAAGGLAEGGDIPTVGIYADSGWGKTTVINNVAKSLEFNYFRLELDKVPTDVIMGFPYLADVEDADSSVKEDRMSRARKVVQMAESDILPPHKAAGNWLMFFDEFNRADTEKMAAVMNLLMTGELGGASTARGSGPKGKSVAEKYRLPEKVVIVIAMNTGTEDNLMDATNGVQNIDIATLGRIPTIYKGKHSVTSFLKAFGSKPYLHKTKDGSTYYVPNRLAPILMNYMLHLSTEAGGYDPQKALTMPIGVQKGKAGGGEKSTSPRLWTQVTDEMLRLAKQRWDKMSDDEKSQYKSKAEDLMKEVQKNKHGVVDTKGREIKSDPSKDVGDYLFGAWWRDPVVQAELATEVSGMFGDEGKEFVDNIIREWRKVAQRGISIDEMILNYAKKRSLIKKNFRQLGFGTKPQLLANVFNNLKKYSSPGEIETYMKKRGWPVLSKEGIVDQIAQTLEVLYKDLKFDHDDFVALSHLIHNAAKDDHPVFRPLHRIMAGEWDDYIEALKKKLKTKSMVEKELDKLGGEKKKGKEEEGDEEANEGKVASFLKQLDEIRK